MNKETYEALKRLVECGTWNIGKGTEIQDNDVTQVEMWIDEVAREYEENENKTRLFYVVDSLEDNEELFETYEEAEKYHKSLLKTNKPRIWVSETRNAFRETGGSWNYDDRLDTFDFIHSKI